MIDLSIPAIERVERYRSIIPDWEAFLDALRRPLPLCLWTNTLRTDPKRVNHQLHDNGIEAQPLDWWPSAFKGPPSEAAGQSIAFVAGLYHIQEEVSLLPVRLLDPQPHERIADLCAAPGNKTAQTAVAMHNTGTIIANDRDAMRMRATRGTLDRLGVVNTTITTVDASNFPPEAGMFDRVLVDVPCTCEGTSRKNAGAFVRSGREKSESLHKRQLAILRKAVQVCRPGGRIIYATCTYAPEENEMVVDAALREFGSMIRLSAAHIEGVASSRGITTWNGRQMHPSLERTMRVWPHQNDSGGFFVAVIEKSDAAGAEKITFGRDATDFALTQEEKIRWTDLLYERFAIPRETFEPWHFHEPNNKYVAAVSREHRSVSNPQPVSIGMPMVRVGLRYPKLTTAGARLVGSEARKNVVDATIEQATAYLGRRDFAMTESQAEQVEGTGYVIVLLEDVVLGVGLYLDDDRRVRSMFPKVLSRAVSD